MIEKKTEETFQEALALKNASHYEQAVELFTALINTDDIVPDPIQIANCLLEAGECYYYMNQYDNALAFFNRLLLFLEQLPNELILKADVYENLGICYGEKGNQESEIKYKEAALLLRCQILPNNDIIIGQSYSNLGYIYERVGDYQKGLSYCKQALQIFEQHIEAKIHMAICYNNIGNCYSAMGDYENALIYHTEALRNRRMIATAPAQLWVLLNNIGNDYMNQEVYLETETYFLEALDIAQQIKLNQTYNLQIAITRNNLGVCYRKQKKYDLATQQHLLALHVLQQLPNNSPSHQMANLCNLGEIYIEQKLYDNAINYYQNALQIAQNATLDTTYRATAQQGIAVCLSNKGQYEQALHYYEQALTELTTANKPNNGAITAQKPQQILDNYKDPKTLVIIWKGKADALYQLYKQQAQPLNHHKATHNPNQLIKALDTCRQALQYLKYLRRSYQAENAKIQLTKKAYSICEQALHIIFELSEKTQNKQLLYEAFAIAEQSKALSLLANLQHTEAKHKTNIDPNLLAQEQQLQADLNVLDRYLRQENQKGSHANAQLINEWQTRYFTYQERYTALIEQLETDYPDYYHLKYNTNIASVLDIQEKINDHSAVLSYFVSESKIYTFYITKQQYIAQHHPKQNNFSQIIQDFLRAIKTIDKRKYAQIAHELYQALALPTLLETENKQTNIAKNNANSSKINNIILIPDRELLYLPFDALFYKALTNLNTPYGNMPYCLHKYAFSYHYSATLWLQKNQKHPKKTSKNTDTKGLLAFAPTQFTSNNQVNNFRPLLFSKEMLLSLKNTFYKHQLPAQTYEGEKATLHNFKQQASKYHYILLYTHAELNEIQPALSRILFTHQPNSGDCYMADTYNLTLNADLVVLGACETGIGKLQKGEGMVGINRGFLYAGAHNLLFSLLKVPEQSAMQLITLLFEQILSKPSNYAQALQTAKQQLLQDNKHLPPLAWTGWVLLGD